MDLSGFESYFPLESLRQTQQEGLDLIKITIYLIDSLATFAKVTDKISLSLDQLGDCLLQTYGIWIRAFFLHCFSVKVLAKGSPILP